MSQSAMLLKLARPRTWFFVITAFFIGLSIGGSQSSWKAMLGLGIFITWVGVTNIFNSYTDKAEDSVNLQVRSNMVQAVGDGKLLWFCIAAYAITGIFAVFVNVQFFLVYLMAIFESIFYSAKPLRLKARPGFDLVAFSGSIFFPMLGGWVLLEKDFAEFPVLFIFLAYWFLVYGTIKNIPDFEGDRRVGIRNSATVFATRRQAVKVSFLLLISPYLLLAFLVSADLLQRGLLLNMGWLPVVALIHFDQTEGDSFHKLERAHTIGFFYAFGFLGTSLLILTSASVWAILFMSSSIAILSMIYRRKVDSR